MHSDGSSHFPNDSNYYRQVNVASLEVGQPNPALSIGGPTITLRSCELTDVPFSLILTRPADEPELWDQYLLGALKSYRKYAVERVLEYDKVRTGQSTTLFVAIVDRHGDVVGGVRTQGPYGHPNESHALVEWDGRPGTEMLRRQIESRIPEGLVEMKTGWVSDDLDARHVLAGAIARTPIHVLSLLGIRHALCTVADHAVRRWGTTGAQISGAVPAVAYPDDRYRTVPIWWDRATLLQRMDPAHLGPLFDEQEQLGLHLGRAELCSRAA